MTLDLLGPQMRQASSAAAVAVEVAESWYYGSAAAGELMAVGAKASIPGFVNLVVVEVLFSIPFH